MSYELDHLFVIAQPGAPEAERLIELGLVEGSPNTHPGQGTANRRFYFHSSMLELLYATDEGELRSPVVEQIRLWDRSRWRQTAACPFGLTLRATSDDPPPFTTFDYAPLWVPEGFTIPMARGTMAVEPLLFINPMGQRPDAYPSDRHEPLDHPLGVREITGVHIVSAGCELPSDPLRAVKRLGIATFSQGEGHLLEVTLDDGKRGKSADLRPDLPLVLRW
jgi:hypothetical protein